eukprot:PITA_20855
MEINHAKSKFFFFNTHLAIQKHLTGILGFKRSNLPSKYLGAPLTSKPWQKHHWESTLAKLERKCKHWTHRALNFAGRLVLTKAILQAIPHYLLSILPAPQGILHRIRTIQRKFLWKGNAKKNKWALVAGNKLCKSKSLGGLNLIDPLTSNNICGAKLWWRWLKEPHLPWAKHWKEKYTPNCNEKDLIWLQEQLPRLATPDLENYKREVQTAGNYKVNQYWSQETNEQEWRTWNSPNSLSFTAKSAQIQSLLSTLNKRKIRSSSASDQLRWGMKGNGSYTLKEARMQLEWNEQGEILPWSTKVWDNLFWPKIKTFLWLLMRGKTLTWDNL